MPQPLTTASGPTDWNEAMDIISFGSPEQVKDFFFFFFFPDEFLLLGVAFAFLCTNRYS